MKRFFFIAAIALLAASCDNGYLESENVEQLVVEGWIESGHAPVVFVSSTMPVSSTPRPISDINEHILRYAEVYIDHNGIREYLTARLTDRYTIQNYFTSPTLRGTVGESYRLHVKWLDYEADAICTIPEPVPIDTAWFEKGINDTSFVAKLTFKNNPADKRYYQSFLRIGDYTNNFKEVNFTSLDGSLIGTDIIETFMKPLSETEWNDVYFHPGDTVAVKLATTEKPIYEFWSSYANYTNSEGTVLTAPTNLKGNIKNAIGYWAGYGIDIREIIIPR